MEAFVLVGRSCDTVVLLGETRIATQWLSFLPECFPKGLTSL